MKAKKIVIGVLLAVIGLPVLLVLVVVVSVAILDRTNGTIVSSGKPRSFLLYVPPSYDRAKPTPLVISMHGAAGWPAQQMNLSRWNRLAESQGFVVVYPSGSDVPKIWHVDRGAGRGGSTHGLELVYRSATGPGDCVSRGRRSNCTVPGRAVG